MTDEATTAAVVPPVALPALDVATLTAQYTRILSYLALPIKFTPSSWGLQSLLTIAQTAVASSTVMGDITGAINLARADGLTLQVIEADIVAAIKALEAKV